MSHFLRPSLQGNQDIFRNYAVREPAACDLSLVTGPFIWQEEFGRALERATFQDVQSYALPNENPALLEAIAQQEGLPADSIILASGADSALETIQSRYLESGDVFGILSPNFPRFGIYAATIQGLKVVEFSNLEDLPPAAKLVSVCTPNNPSTEELSEAVLRKVITANPEVLFCIDAVFDWYGSFHLASLCKEFDNVLVLKSFSKIGLAGLRLGYTLGNPDLIADLKLGSSPFTVPAIVQSIGLEIARSFDRIQEIRQGVEDEFSYLDSALGERIVRHTPVPFYIFRTSGNSTHATDKLAEQGISVVDCAHFSGLPSGCLRVSIGTRQQNRLLVAAILEVGI